jgi:hypothetical protein
MNKKIKVLLLIASLTLVCAFDSTTSKADNTDSVAASHRKNLTCTGKLNMKTVCNPMDLRYPFIKADDSGSRREMADPAAVLFEGEYYLFASKSGGVWHSPDLVKWHFVSSKVLPVEDYAPGVAVYNDAIVFTASNNSNIDTRKIYSSTDPKSDDWEVVADRWPLPMWDPSFLVDDDNRVYFFWGCSPTDPLYGIELDTDNGFEPIGEVQELLWAEPDLHGWEVNGDYNTVYEYDTWMEGPWVNKIGGQYYLQYAVPGTEVKSYNDGVYVSDSPLGPYTIASHNPFAYKPEGFACGAGHGATITDKHGNLWHRRTLTTSRKHMFERRLAMYPVFVDDDGWLYSITKYGDYPMIIPDKKIKSFDDVFPGWMLLSYNKEVTVSSSLGEYPPGNMTDENIRTSFAAESGDAGEWAMLDLGDVYDIYALQINFAEVETTVTGGAEEEGLRHRYIVEVSTDAENWKMLLNKSRNDDDHTHVYEQLKTKAKGRYVRITNIEVPDGMFALSGFRVFGKGKGNAPAKVTHFNVARNTEDRRQANLEWDEANGAVGYTISFGVDPDKLYNNYMVYDDTSVTISTLSTEQDYYFTIESFNENGITKSEIIEAAK